MGTRAVNPLERVDLELVEFWVSKKMETLEHADSGFNQEDYALDDEYIDSHTFGDEELDYGEYFEQWTSRFSELLEERLIDVEDLQDFLVWLEYVSPEDEADGRSLNDIKSKISAKIQGVERRES